MIKDLRRVKGAVGFARGGAGRRRSESGHWAGAGGFSIKKDIMHSTYQKDFSPPRVSLAERRPGEVGGRDRAGGAETVGPRLSAILTGEIRRLALDLERRL